MPLVDVPFPLSNAPGSAPGEGAGRLVNCYAYKDGSSPRWRAVPGLDAFATGLPGPVRGALLVGPLLYLVAGASVVQVTQDGTATVLEGSVPGSGPVTMERNNAVPPQVAIVSNRDAYLCDGERVSGWPDPVLPQPNSVAFLDGYFLFTTASAQIYATGLNTATIGASSGSDAGNPLSFTTAEARPDGLLRGVSYAQQFYAFGASTIEVYQDVGASPFPLARVSVIPCGLFGPWAVAGDRDGWSEALVFVAADGSVRRLDGYTPTRISGEDLERLIQAVADPRDIELCAYTFGSNAVVSVSAPGWTWEFNLTTGFWHERESYARDPGTSDGAGGWRARRSVRAFGRWLVGDAAAPDLLALDPTSAREAGDPLVWGADSGPVKQFPARIAVPGVAYDFALGAAPAGDDPQALLSWSHDGGRTWSSPLARSLGVQGRAVGPIRVFRLGLATHHGIRHRFRVSDGAYTSLAGARMEAQQRRP